jgi:hypothetical protein
VSQRHRAAAFARWRKQRAREQTVWWLEYAAERARLRAVDLAAKASAAKHPADARKLRGMACANIDASYTLAGIADDVRDGNWPVPHA